MDPNKIDWTNNIVTAVLSIVVTIVAGVVLYYWQTNEPEITYSYTRIEPFESQKEDKLSIYHISVLNSGSTSIEDVKTIVSLEPAIIKEFKVIPNQPFSIKDSLNNNRIDVSVQSLNKGESFKISLLAKTEAEFPQEPKIYIRGKDVIGTKTDDNTLIEAQKIPFPGALKSMIVIATVPLLLFFSLSRIRSASGTVREGKHQDNQKRILAYICGTHGLIEEVDRYLGLPSKTAYYAEIDRLTALSLSKNESDYALKVKQIIVDLIKYASMSDDSVAICYYNLARIEKFLGNQLEAANYLDTAKKHGKILINKRLEIDTLFTS